MPFSLSVMASMLNELMVAAGIIVATASVYDRFTWHSARVTLACQLRKLNYGWDKITSHLRHKSAESARIYGRLDAIGYADTAAKASSADASGVLAADLPEIDPVAKHAGMQDAIAAMEAMVVSDAEKLNESAGRRGRAHRMWLSERHSRSWRLKRQLRRRKRNGSRPSKRRRWRSPAAERCSTSVKTQTSRRILLTRGVSSDETCLFQMWHGEASSTTDALHYVAWLGWLIARTWCRQEAFTIRLRWRICVYTCRRRRMRSSCRISGV